MTEHEEMMKAFCEYHGAGRDYKTKEEHDMWLVWLGCFSLGWNSSKKRLLTKRPPDRLMASALIVSVLINMVVLTLLLMGGGR